MKCFECNKDYVKATRTHVVDMKNFIIIIRNVPCWECMHCGDSVYDDTVAERLNAIVQNLNNFMGEIAVVEYTGNQAA